MNWGVDEPILCSCLHVTEGEVKAAIADGAASIEAVGEACEAGTGCQSCHGGITILLEAHLKREVRAGRTPEELKQLTLFDQLQGGRKAAPTGGAHKKD